jgi:hypothetical protein
MMELLRGFHEGRRLRVGYLRQDRRYEGRRMAPEDRDQGRLQGWFRLPVPPEGEKQFQFGLIMEKLTG